MANIECNGNIKTNQIEVQGSFTALKNIGDGFSITDPTNVGIDLGRKDGIAGTPYINFHTDGNAGTNYNSRIIAQANSLNLISSSGLMINNTQMGDFVVEQGVIDNKWYRVWNSGMIENGGTSTKIADYGNYSANFLRPFSNNNYSYSLGTLYTVDDSTWNSAYMIKDKDATGLSIFSRGAKNGGRYVSWYTCGK